MFIVTDDDDDWSGNEEDNHSDWEKLPRPNQSTAASPSQKPDKKPENVSVEKSTQKVPSDSHAVPSRADCCELDMNKPTVKSVNKQTVESNMSAIAASSAQSKDEPTPESTVPSRLSSEPVASQEGQDASTDLLSQDLQLIPSADLWSLHIPNDIASASQTQQDIEIGVIEPVSSLDVYKQAGESRNASGESNSWAACGDDFSAVTDEKPPVVLADGACGTVDIGEDPASPQQASELCSDISAASVEIPAESCLAQAEAVSCHSVSAAKELIDLSETVSEVASAFSSEAKDQPISEPASANPVAAVSGSAPANPVSAVTEVAPTADTISLNKENIAVSPVATVLKELNASQETSNVSKKETDPSSDNLELSDRKESVLLSDVADGGEVKEIAMRLKGDMIVVGDRDSPLSSESTGTKGGCISSIHIELFVKSFVLEYCSFYHLFSSPIIFNQIYFMRT